MKKKIETPPRDLAHTLWRPFAVAFAAFLREMSNASSSELEKIMRLGEATAAADSESEFQEQRMSDLPPEERQSVSAAWEEVQRQDQNGTLVKLELEKYTPEAVAGNRLRQVIQDEGISQADLAKRLGVSPAVISRMLKEPDRSAVKTLRRVAQALDVDVHEIIDR